MPASPGHSWALSSCHRRSGGEQKAAEHHQHRPVAVSSNTRHKKIAHFCNSAEIGMREGGSRCSDSDPRWSGKPRWKLVVTVFGQERNKRPGAVSVVITSLSFTIPVTTRVRGTVTMSGDGQYWSSEHLSESYHCSTTRINIINRVNTTTTNTTVTISHLSLHVALGGLQSVRMSH